MEGEHDPDCRRGFPWDEGQWDLDLRAFVQRCISLRKAHPALRRGDFAWLLAEDNVVAYVRRLEDEAVLVALNNSRKAVTVDLPVRDILEEDMQVREVWNGTTKRVHDGNVQAVDIPARSGTVFLADAKPAS